MKWLERFFGFFDYCWYGDNEYYEYFRNGVIFLGLLLSGFGIWDSGLELDYGSCCLWWGFFIFEVFYFILLFWEFYSLMFFYNVMKILIYCWNM